MKTKISTTKQGGNDTVSITCPHCGFRGVFIVVTQDVIEHTTGRHFGQRKCPRPECNGHIFFISGGNNRVFVTYPRSSIPFDTTSIPIKIASSMTEAIECFANECYIASGIMIRKTLEEICIHEGCKGGTLFVKLKALETKITMPAALIDGMSDLRLLGNDAAHVEAETYEKIEREEISASLAVTLEILKAMYQYEEIIGRLKALKKV